MSTGRRSAVGLGVGGFRDTSGVELVLTGSRPLTTATFFSGLGPNTLDIDATKLTYACPLDLAGMVAMSHWAARDGMRVTLRLPEDSKVTAHLQRMDVLRQMPADLRIIGSLPRDVGTDDRDTLLPVTALNQRNVDDLLAERLGPLVTGAYRGRSESAGVEVFRACSELLSNATEHGSSDHGAFTAAQLHAGPTGVTSRFEFAVCDAGIGVMNHLRRNPAWDHLRRDELAIAKALEAGVSGITTAGRGYGLTDAIKDGRAHGTVVLQIRSGSGDVTVVGTPAAAHARQLRSRVDQTSGTWAWLTHRLQRQVQTVLQSAQ